ncbi:MAG: leucine-rich repeat domain-containing protein [Clostridia bacterium]|nr:leucine-rich repeat domain-containing protein [Clostridia bacterium]
MKNKRICIIWFVLLLVFVALVSCNDSAHKLPEDTKNQESEGAPDDIIENTVGDETDDKKETEPPIIILDDCEKHDKEHNWKEWEVIVPSTCTIQGEHKRECYDCRVIEQEAAPLHNLVVNAAREVTCTRKGWEEYVSCRDCDFTTYREVEALDHNYKNNFCKNCGRTALSMGIIRGEAVAFGIGCYGGNELVIPAQHNGFPVTQIGLNSFPDLYGIKSITFPSTIVGMYPFAFNNCPDLKLIYAPKGMEELIDLHFDGAKKLSRVYYLDPTELENYTPTEKVDNPSCYVDVKMIGVTLTVVGVGDFPGENIVIPETYGGTTISAIADGAFENCDQIRSVVMPCSIEKIGSRAFAGCTSLREVIFEDSNNDKAKVEISQDAFEGCSDIHLEIPWNLCEDLACFEEAVTIATIHSGVDGWTSIYPGQARKDGDTEGPNIVKVSCVKYLKNLHTLIIGDDVVGIWDYAFQYCNNFETLIISGNVMKMGVKPFEGCSRLKKVILKKGVSAISVEAFKDCSAINECIVEAPFDWATNEILTDPRAAARWLTSKTVKTRPPKQR